MEDAYSAVEEENMYAIRREAEEDNEQKVDEVEFVEWPGGVADYAEALKAKGEEPADEPLVTEGEREAEVEPE